MSNSKTDLRRAAILSIGTEVVSGDIANSNAQWLSQKLSDLRWNPTTHVTVPDDHDSINQALDFLSSNHELILTTGGLGPTSDDFTRIALCEWLEVKLSFDEDSWVKIQGMYESRGQTPTKNNMQQCYFPIESQILNNSSGTANAFTIRKNNTQYVCLPGPPHEIKAIWDEHLRALLRLEHDEDTTNVLRWNCLGAGESMLAEKVEEIMGPTGLQIGFRPHIPYVEVKIWATPSQESFHRKSFEKLRQELSNWLIYEGDQSPTKRFLNTLSRFDEPIIFDTGTNGLFSDAIIKEWALISRESETSIPCTLVTELNETPEEMPTEELVADDDSLLLTIGSMTADGGWRISVHLGEEHITQKLQSPYPSHGRMKYRALAAMVQLSLVHFSKILSSGINHAPIN